MTQTKQADFQSRCINNLEQANLLSDFSTWQYSRMQENLPHSHDTWVSLKERNAAEGERLNEEAKQSHRATLENELKADKARTEQTIDAELEPTKQQLMREWLVNNPSETAEAFEKKAWIHLRANLIAERADAQMAAELQKARAEMDYF